MFYENLTGSWCWGSCSGRAPSVARRSSTHPRFRLVTHNAKRHVPSSRARRTIARCVGGRIPRRCGATRASPVCSRGVNGKVRAVGARPFAPRGMRAPTRTVIITATPIRPSTPWSGMANEARMAFNGSGVRPAGKRFSSRLGTALYRLRTPAAQVAQVLLAVNLGLTIADAQLLFGHSEVTIRLWLTRAGQHAEKVHTHFFRNLHLGHLQLDELFTTLRDKAHDLWVWVAFDPATKLIPALQLGPRTQTHGLCSASRRHARPGSGLSAGLYQ